MHVNNIHKCLNEVTVSNKGVSCERYLRPQRQSTWGCWNMWLFGLCVIDAGTDARRNERKKIRGRWRMRMRSWRRKHKVCEQHPQECGGEKESDVVIEDHTRHRNAVTTKNDEMEEKECIKGGSMLTRREEEAVTPWAKGERELAAVTDQEEETATPGNQQQQQDRKRW